MRVVMMTALLVAGCDDGSSKDSDWTLDSGLLTDDSDDTNTGSFEPGCTVEIPSTAGVISGTHEANKPDEVAWLCSGASVSADAADSIYFVESGAEIDVNSANALIFVKAGGSVNVDSTTVTVYYEDKADLVLNVPLFEANACDAVVFTGGPDPGC